MLAGWFARRYFFSKKSHSVINLIAGVSVVSRGRSGGGDDRSAVGFQRLRATGAVDEFAFRRRSDAHAPRGTDVRDRIARYGRAAAASRRGGGVAGARTERAHGVPRPSGDGDGAGRRRRLRSGGSRGRVHYGGRLRRPAGRSRPARRRPRRGLRTRTALAGRVRRCALRPAPHRILVAAARRGLHASAGGGGGGLRGRPPRPTAATSSPRSGWRRSSSPIPIGRRRPWSAWPAAHVRRR